MAPAEIRGRGPTSAIPKSGAPLPDSADVKSGEPPPDSADVTSAGARCGPRFFENALGMSWYGIVLKGNNIAE